MFFQGAHDVGDRRHLLADSHVDTLNARTFLVDDGIDRDRGLTDLAVTDNQLALASANRNHRIDTLQADLYRLINALAFNNARGDFLYRLHRGRIDRAFAVDGITQRINHAAQQLRAHRYFEDSAGAARGHAFAEAKVVAEDNHTDRITLEVQRHSVQAVAQVNHFAVLGIGQSVNTNDAVGHRHDGAFVLSLGLDVQAFNAAANNVADF